MNESTKETNNPSNRFASIFDRAAATKATNNPSNRFASIFDRAAAKLENFKAKSQGEAGRTIYELKATIQKLEASMRSQTAELEQLRVTNKQLASHASSVSSGIVNQMAALGFPADRLPASASEDSTAAEEAPSTAAAFMERHAALTAQDCDKASLFYSKYAKKFGYA